MFEFVGCWLLGRISSRSLLLGTLTIIAAASIGSPAQAFVRSQQNSQIAYYGDDFYQQVLNRERDKDLISSLRSILTSMHMRHPGALDEVVSRCDLANQNCYSQHAVGYSAARKLVLGQLDLDMSGPTPGIREVYCQRLFTAADFPGGVKPGPGHTPDPNIINIEHTWPQSRFGSSAPKETQKSDLHHLFATDNKMNSIRGNMKFGEVDRPAYQLPCPVSKMGVLDATGEDVFEPPQAHRGNVARALFYFSVRYSLKIDVNEEGFLKKWNHEDPVDDAERARNNAIEKLQGNRNPFVDYPEMADQIADF